LDPPAIASTDVRGLRIEQTIGGDPFQAMRDPAGDALGASRPSSTENPRIASFPFSPSTLLIAVCAATTPSSQAYKERLA
jgi:hypothetical protein